MNFQNKKSKSFDICFPNKFFPKIKIRKCFSLPNKKIYVIKNNISTETEEIGYMVEQSTEKDNIKNKSFDNNKTKKKTKPFLDINDDEQSLTTNSKQLNTSLINNKNDITINNNKEYIIVPKSKKKDTMKRKLNSNIINNKFLIDNISGNSIIDNNDSHYNNLLYNNYKTFEYNNNKFLHRDIINSTQKITFDDLSIVSKINTVDEKEDNINIIEEDDDFLKDNDIENKKNINKYKVIIYKLSKEKIELEEKISNAILTNNELKNYIEILKQTIENFIIKSGYKDIIDKISKDMNKSSISLLTEFTKYKLENEKIKKSLLMQQILSTDMKEEIKNIKKENDNLIKLNKKILSEKKTYINNNLSNDNNLIDRINNDNDNDFECLKQLTKIYKELNDNYLRLQNDFSSLSQNNEDIIKYNEKLIKENEKLKNEINYKNKTKNNKENNNNIDDNEMNDLINKIKDLENHNMEFQLIIEKQKKEIEKMNNIINDKDNEIIQYNKDIENLNNKDYKNINESTHNNQELFTLKNKIIKIEDIINEIFEKQIKQNQKISTKKIYMFSPYINNIEDKIKNIKIFIEQLIEEINISNKKIIENEKNKCIKKIYFSGLKEDQIISFNITNEYKENNKENDYNSNSIHNSFEDFSMIKQRDNQSNSNYDLFFSNNNVIINKDIGEYNNMIDKLNNLLSTRNKNLNNKNNDDNNKDYICKNKMNVKTPSSSNNIKNIPKNNNSLNNKSFSPNQTKIENKYIDIINNRNEKLLTKKIKTEFVASEKFLNLEEEKINNKKGNIQKKSLIFKKKEENKNESNDHFYITMPYKFNKIENNYVAKKKCQSNSKINYSNNSYNIKNTKFSQGSQTKTIDSSSRMFTTNIVLNNNEYSFRNINKEIKKKNSQVFALKKYKNIKNYMINSNNNKNSEKNKDKHYFAEEVLKPTFLRSDVPSTLFNYYNNPSSNKNSNSKFSYENLYNNLNYL